MSEHENWFEIKNIDEIDTPGFVIYPERIHYNIRKMIDMVGGPERLRPHVKTNKMREITEMMMREGITKFKCATIAEAEMLGLAEAQDILLAYQPVGPKINRLLNLVRVFPRSQFSTLVDSETGVTEIAGIFADSGHVMGIFMDLNVGNDRTGIKPGTDSEKLFQKCRDLPGVEFRGFHIYDGHIRSRELKKRTKKCNRDFRKAEEFIDIIRGQTGMEFEIIAGGSPTFPVHAAREGVVCSPGTVLLWDYGYGSRFTDLEFQWAALVITRVISIIDEDHICVDLGHKSIASENPFPRVHFLNTGKLEQVSHSEEHLVLRIQDDRTYRIGDIFYGVPFHICPTTALYERAYVVENGEVHDDWLIIARDKRITI